MIHTGGRAPLIARIAGRIASFFRRGTEIPLEPLAHVSPIPEAAVDEIAADRWLADLVRFHLSIGDSYHNLVAAGILLRLREAHPPGLPTVEGSHPHRWFKGLSEEERRAAVRRIIARIHGLWCDLEVLEHEHARDPEDPDWQVCFLGFCQDRDDLESAVVLPRWAGLGGAFNGLLHLFDEAAARFAQIVRAWHGPKIYAEDEQLLRAAIVYHDRWWTQAAAPFFR